MIAVIPGDPSDPRRLNFDPGAVEGVCMLNGSPSAGAPKGAAEPPRRTPKIDSSARRLDPAPFVDPIEQSVLEAEQAGVIRQSISTSPYTGRHVEIGAQRLLNFGGCSYLGLELRPELKAAVSDAVRRYGTQFSFSRAYLTSSLYPELESELEHITDRPVVVSASTTLGHIAALPVLVEPGDAVVIDQFAHASLHTAAGLLHQAHVLPVRHSKISALSAKLVELSRSHRRIWYVLDGLYSMHGDFAPFEELSALLEQHPQLYLYVDDAHATSWCGVHGRGRALEQLADTSRAVVALSLNKCFSAAGGALVFPDARLRDRVRRCGGPMLFSGPIQPPMLAAALASAKLHQTPELPLLQRRLADRIDRVLELARELHVPLTTWARTPIFFVRCGRSQLAFRVVQALRERHLYVCPSVFPAVPRNHAGLRFTVSLHNAMEDIEQLMGEVAAQVREHGLARPSAAAE